MDNNYAFAGNRFIFRKGVNFVKKRIIKLCEFFISILIKFENFIDSIGFHV